MILRVDIRVFSVISPFIFFGVFYSRGYRRGGGGWFEGFKIRSSTF